MFRFNAAKNLYRSIIVIVMAKRLKFKEDDHIAGIRLASINMGDVSIPSEGQLTLLQFRASISSALAQYQWAKYQRLLPQLQEAKLQIITVFYSDETSLKHLVTAQTPAIPDPNGQLFRQFGINKAGIKNFHPAALLAQYVFAKPGHVKISEAPVSQPLPADVLINGQGKVVYSHYGRHPNDYLPAKRALAIAKRTPVSEVATIRKRPFEL